jgi:hypothetical protein
MGTSPEKLWLGFMPVNPVYKQEKQKNEFLLKQIFYEISTPKTKLKEMAGLLISQPT